ncbi:MAG: hypothetical protein ACSW8F_06520, partial [bacterium]
MISSFFSGLLYAAVWLCLSRMAGVGFTGAGFLLPGLLVSLAPRKRWGIGAGAALLGLGMLLFSLDGVKLLLNRLMLASMERQAYLYNLFPTAGGAFGLSLAALGLLAGALLSLGGTLAAGLLVLALCAGAAYLGVTPGFGYCFFLMLAVAFRLAEPRRAALLLVTLTVCAAFLVSFFLFPGEDLALSQWEERTRDRLALSTMGTAPALPPEQNPAVSAQTQERVFYREEETLGDVGGGMALPVPPPVALILILLALLLFVPALFRDFLEKRRQRNRRFLKEADNALAAQGMFLHALKWLRLAGVEAGNAPYSALEVPPPLRDAYAEALPLWQEAAYAGGAFSPEKRE